MISAPFVVRKAEMTFYYKRWIKPRIEHLANGTTVVYFGFGRILWR